MLKFINALDLIPLAVCTRKLLLFALSVLCWAKPIGVCVRFCLLFVVDSGGFNLTDYPFAKVSAKASELTFRGKLKKEFWCVLLIVCCVIELLFGESYRIYPPVIKEPPLVVVT